MKKKLLFAVASLLFVGCSIQTSSSNNQTSSEETSSSINEEITTTSSDIFSSTSEEEPSSSESSEVSSEEEIKTKTQSFYHKFEQSDFDKSGGTLAINGVTFTYSEFSFLGGATQGVQIGSKNNPQTKLWELKTSFNEEIVITSFNVELANASGGSGVYTYSFGDYTKQSSFSTQQQLNKFGEENLSVKTNDLTFSLIANSRAMYFYSLSFTCETFVDSTLELTGDKYEANPVVPGENSIPAVNYTLTTKEEYYQNINLTSDKDILLSDLRELVSTMTQTSYGDAKTMLQYVDEHPTEKGYLYGAFDGDLIPAKWDSGASWNREHIWACARMNLNGDSRPDESTKNHATDLHNLRVTCQMANGKHGDAYYDEEGTAGFYPNVTSLIGYHAYEGDFRGDTARILFYMCVRYEGLKLVSGNITDSVSNGNLTTLLRWNELDPVDDFEIQRNNRIFEYQGNRNPFIDYSSLANVIFG